MSNRIVVLDTETTGLETALGHRIIEIGCVEIINRRLTGNHYHQYINPEREIDAGAMEVHGITNEFVANKPVFSSIAEEFMAFVDGAELVIHNAWVLSTTSLSSPVLNIVIFANIAVLLIHWQWLVKNIPVNALLWMRFVNVMA
jgi:inhibitor of KinA sporulation pathway (predicted exonuclease)